jgi:hypothetical protein
MTRYLLVTGMRKVGEEGSQSCGSMTSIEEQDGSRA